MQTKSLITFLIIIAILLVGFFYWKPLSKNGEINITPEQQEKITNPEQKDTESQENEIATSTPLVIKGEISRGNPNKKQIIFTFDGGAGNNSADKILETAQKHNLKLTFFVTGKFAEKYPDLIKKITANGHEVFNHTYSHPHLTQLSDEQIKEELERADRVINNLTGTTTKPFFRPPYGERNQHVLQVASELGYQSVFWTIDAWDWMPDKTAEQVKQRIYSNLKNGTIFLMHVGDDVSGNILDDVFTKIESEGYEIVGLTEGIK